MTTPIRIALAQLNLWVGDLTGNLDKIRAATQQARAKAADLIVFPELAVVGYPPDDLLLRSGLPAEVEAALQKLAAESHDIALLVGHPEFTTDGLYNAASLFQSGRCAARYRKQRLPNYGVFDELRHFRAGDSATVFEIKGQRFGITICEDIWYPEPAAKAKTAGAQCLINLNASPFEQGKSQRRAAVLRTRTQETGLPVLYVNAVGGQDDLVFDGDSQICTPVSDIAWRAPSFVEGVYLLEVQPPAVTALAVTTPESSEDAAIWQALVQATRDYVNRNGFKGAVLGLSGGIDSAVVLAIAVDALGADRVRAIAMPSRYTADMSNEDALEQARRMGVCCETISIEPLFQAYLDRLAPQFSGLPIDITEENLQSRCRGVLLMALSNKFGEIVLTTGNKSEMATGYATLYGDMCGGFAPIKDVYKTQVFRLANYRNQISPVIPQRVIDRPPSAELRPDQKDQDSLPEYVMLDPIIKAYVEQSHSIAEIVAMGYDETTVRRVAGLIRRSEYKRRQSAPGPKITRCAFGRERRYPLTAVYGDL